MKTALVAGSTGLIGRYLLDTLLASNRYDVVKAITRSDLPISHPKLQVIRAEFNTLESQRDQLKADDVFCCLGTTMAKVKSKDKFREVDYSYPLALAKLTSEIGAKQFMIVSALGADPKSSIFYNKVKGEAEEAVSKIRFHAVHIFRPSLLLGDRNESRPGEEAAKIFYKIFWFILPDKYKAIEGEKVARAMAHFAAQDQQGVFVHESRDLQQF